MDAALGWLDSDILIAQRYREDDALALIRSLLPAFADRRYVRIDGKPLFLVYCADAIPDPERWAAIWRGAARDAGHPDLYLALVQSVNQKTMDPSTIGYDAAGGVSTASDSFAASRARPEQRSSSAFGATFSTMFRARRTHSPGRVPTIACFAA